MNLLLIDKEYQKLNIVEDYINYKFEPRSRSYKCKRHIYYNDLKNDFVDEVNAYGFSPFIQETYDNQRKDKKIMRFKTNYLNQGLINYVKKKNKNEHGPTVVEYKIKDANWEKERKKYFPKSARYLVAKGEDNLPGHFGGNTVETTTQNMKNQKENFLQKALENLARNKLNISEDSNIFSNEKEAKKGGRGGNTIGNNMGNLNKTNVNSNNTNKGVNNQNAQNTTSQNLDFEQLRLNYINSLHYKVNLNPILSISNFSQPEPLKVNFERFFKNAKLVKKATMNNQAELRKLVGLFKNKDVMQNLRNLKKELQEKEDKMYDKVGVNEIKRDNVDLKSSIKITSKRKENVFKKLYNLSQNEKRGKSAENKSKNKKSKQKLPNTSSANIPNTAGIGNVKSINQLYIDNIKNLNNHTNLLKHNQDTDNLNEELSRKIIEKSPHSLIKKVNLKLKSK